MTGGERMDQHYLEVLTATELIGVIVGGQQVDRRLCEQDDATIAVAGVLLGLSAAVIQQRLKYIFRQVVTKTSEVKLETLFQPQKVRTHAIRIKGLEPSLRALHEEIVNGEAAGAVFAHVDKPEVKQCVKSIASSVSLLKKIVSLLPKDTAGSRQLTKSEIEQLLKSTLPAQLVKLSKKLEVSLKHFEVLREKGKNEWKDSVELLRKCAFGSHRYDGPNSEGTRMTPLG
jgi:hypothetical protein